MKVYDLTLPFAIDMIVFPGTPSMDYELSQTIAKDNYNLGIASINTHAGTHTDAPLHFIQGGDSLEKIDVCKYIGKAVVADCSVKSDFDEINVSDLLPYSEKIADYKRVIIKTGWSKHFNEPKYFTDYPVITLELANWLVGLGVLMVGVEPPSLNPGKYIEVHKALLSAGVAVVEGLTNLETLPEDEIFFIGAPVALKGADGFPLRALGIEF
jgi:kynurenine formamidase